MSRPVSFCQSGMWITARPPATTCRKEIAWECPGFSGTARVRKGALPIRATAVPDVSCRNRSSTGPIISEGVGDQCRYQFGEGGRLTRVCTADRHTLCAGHEGALHNSNTNEQAFRKTGKFWDFPGRGKVGTGTAAASLLPIRLCALKRSSCRTNTVVVLASPQLLIPPTTAPTACVRADPRSHRRPFPVPHRVALP